jgi:hypothetical protein
MNNKFQTIFRSMRVFTAVALCVGFGLLQPSAPLATLAAQAPPPNRQAIFTKFKSQENKFIAEAAAWDNAVRGFASVENMPMKTPADVQKVLAVLERSSAGFKGLHGKTVVLAMNTGAFKTGVEAEAERVTAKGLQLKIRQSPRDVSRLRGFDDAKSAIRRQLQSDSAVLARVSKKLEEASRLRGALPSAPSTESHRLRVARASYHSLAKAISSPASVMQASFSSLNTAMSRLPVEAPVEPGVGEPAAVQTGVEAALIAAAILLIGAFAARKVIDIEPPDDGGPSPFAACMNAAESKRDRCLRRGDFFADIQCWAVFGVDTSRCILLPL